MHFFLFYVCLMHDALYTRVTKYYVTKFMGLKWIVNSVCVFFFFFRIFRPSCETQDTLDTIEIKTKLTGLITHYPWPMCTRALATEPSISPGLGLDLNFANSKSNSLDSVKAKVSNEYNSI